MSEKFEAKLDAIVQMSHPETRSKIKKDLTLLFEQGVDSIETLIAVLENETSEIENETRIFICWLLGQLRNKRAVRVLVKTFRNQKNAHLSLEAAKSLGILGSKRAVKYLIDALTKDGDTDRRFASAYALGLLRDRRAVDPLVSVLIDKKDSPKVRGQAAEALSSFHDSRNQIVDVLIACLCDSSVEVRFWSAFALGELKETRAVPELKRLVETDNEILTGWWSVSEEASAALIRIKS